MADKPPKGAMTADAMRAIVGTVHVDGDDMTYNPVSEELANVWTLAAAVKVLAARVQALEATIEAMQGGK